MGGYRNGGPGFQPRYGQQQQAERQQKQASPLLTGDNYVDIAENAVKALKDKKGNNNRPIEMLTTSQIRNLLAMTADIYNEVVSDNSDKLSRETLERINYLRIRFVYEAGREPKVNNFVQEANLINYLKKAAESKKEYILFSRYMEALVAYHRYYGGKD